MVRDMIWKKSLITALSILVVALFIGTSMSSAVAGNNLEEESQSSTSDSCPLCASEDFNDGDDEPICESCIEAAAEVVSYTIKGLVEKYDHWFILIVPNMAVDFSIFFKQALSKVNFDIGNANLMEEIANKISEVSLLLSSKYDEILEVVNQLLRVGDGDYFSGELIAKSITKLIILSESFIKYSVALIQGFGNYLKKLCNVYSCDDCPDEPPLENLESEIAIAKGESIEQTNSEMSSIPKQTSSVQTIKSKTTAVSSSSAKIITSKPAVPTKTSSVTSSPSKTVVKQSSSQSRVLSSISSAKSLIQLS